MVGKNVIEIGVKEFLDNVCTSPDATDGGYSSETVAINPVVSDALTGILYPPAQLTSRSSPSGSIIATCADPDTGIGVTRYFLTDAAKFYSVSTAYASTLRQSGAKTYAKTTSYMAVFRNKLYATSTLNITEASGATLGTIDEDWWVTTKGKSALTANPHPVLVFEDAVWFGDGNKLHKWDGTTATEGFLTLPTGQVIVDMDIDPSSGLMLISIVEGINSSSTLPRKAKISTYDGYSNKVRRTVIVDEMVTALYPQGGIVYAAYGTNFGQWNGNGITFLHRFTNVTRDTNSLVYKNMITNMGNTIYYADGLTVMAYGELITGQKKLYPAKKVGASLNSILDAIFNLGSQILGIGYTTTGPIANFDTWNQATTSGGGSLTFYSKKYLFTRAVQVREIVIEYADSVANGATPAQFYLIDQEHSQISTYPLLTNDSGGALYKLKTKYNGPRKFYTLQALYENSSHTSVIAGVRRILIYYDFVE